MVTSHIRNPLYAQLFEEEEDQDLQQAGVGDTCLSI